MNQTPILNPIRNHRFKDLSGKVFGRLTVLPLYEVMRTGKKPVTYWDCKCECGNIVSVPVSALRTGATVSCGCYHRARMKQLNKTHGMHKTKPYNSWDAMVQRCTNPATKHYYSYGGRGIAICEKWEKFEGFWEDMAGTYAEGLTLDRIDPNKGYCKDNCRWATRKQQADNRRDTVMITHEGVTKSRTQWAEETGIHCTTIAYRLSRGWSTEKIFSTQPNYPKRNKG